MVITRQGIVATEHPLASQAGATILAQGGNAIDAACAMLGAVTTMWDVLSWGGETQALIYDPNTKKVIGINALGAAPGGATPDYFKAKKLRFGWRPRVATTWFRPSSQSSPPSSASALGAIHRRSCWPFGEMP